MYLYSILIEIYERAIYLQFPMYLSAIIQSLGLIFGSNDNVLDGQTPSFLQSSLPNDTFFEEMRINQVTFVLFVCLFVFIIANVFINSYQVNLGGWILQLGKNPLVKNMPPMPLNVSWGAYSSQYPFAMHGKVYLFTFFQSQIFSCRD